MEAVQLNAVLGHAMPQGAEAVTEGEFQPERVARELLERFFQGGVFGNLRSGEVPQPGPPLLFRVTQEADLLRACGTAEDQRGRGPCGAGLLAGGSGFR